MDGFFWSSNWIVSYHLEKPPGSPNLCLAETKDITGFLLLAFFPSAVPKGSRKCRPMSLSCLRIAEQAAAGGVYPTTIPKLD